MRILQTALNSPSKFKEKLVDYIQELLIYVKEKPDINFDFDEFGDILFSACRTNDYNIINIENNEKLLDKNKITNWINERFIPNIISIDLDDEDVIRLLLFCIEITYQMFAGGTRATITPKRVQRQKENF